MNKTSIHVIALTSVLLATGGCSGEVPTEPTEPTEPIVADANATDGDVFVHLFEWDWPSIALECEQFLGPVGYTAVQVSPPQEHAEGPEWWTRYQPVSYKLESRGGTRAQFVDMVHRCEVAGVAIYVDAVINHMTGVGSGKGVAGTEYGMYEYPPLYDYDDFNHCGRNDGDEIENFDDMWEVHNCELVNLADLKTDKPSVQATLASYLNELLSIGVAGFRLDAAKHMPPDDIADILAMLDSEAFVFQEVIATIDGPVDRSAYADIAQVTEFQFQPPVHRAFSDGDFDGLEKLGEDIGLLPSDLAVVFVDNHDTQRHDDGHAFNYKRGDRYTLANVYMLAWPYGYPKVMSSYAFEDRDAGAPATPPITPDGDSCNDGWVCEHRIAEIANMVAFRAATSGEPVTNWQRHGDAVISFGRGERGQVVINASGEPVNVTVATSLAPGDYCDLLTSSTAVSCDGETIVVNDDRRLEARLGPMTALAILRPH